MPFDGLDIDVAGAISGLKEFRQEIRTELQKEYPKIGAEVVRRAKARAPIGVGTKNPGNLMRSIKQTAAKSSATIRVGGLSSVAYGGPAHWGWKGDDGPWFIWRVGYPKATKEFRGLVADWIYDALTEAMNRAVKRLNYHLGKDIGLSGRAMETGDREFFDTDTGAWSLEGAYAPETYSPPMVRLGIG